MRLLYVDDMTENFFFMENLIIGRDIELFTAINGVQALEIMENNDFDVIVTDIMMPEMDGFTLCRKIITNVPVSTMMGIF
ncbi:MAG TPA: response regulator [Candidatus Cloacimonetes bacterium]|nr:response regulator [Candidatus Cloacimonadota bacterium]